jgi:hypothetical protein
MMHHLIAIVAVIGMAGAAGCAELAEGREPAAPDAAAAEAVREPDSLGLQRDLGEDPEEGGPGRGPVDGPDGGGCAAGGGGGAGAAVLLIAAALVARGTRGRPRSLVRRHRLGHNRRRLAS